MPRHSQGSRLENERRTALETLRAHYMAGQLSLAEYETRADRVIDATDPETIERVVQQVGPSSRGEVVGDDEFGAGRRAVSAVLAERELRGRWRAPGEIAAVAALGKITLDFRDADLDQDVTTIHAVAVLGSVTILVPPGLNVHLNVQQVLGEATAKRLPPPTPQAPCLHVTGHAILGEVKAIGKDGY